MPTITSAPDLPADTTAPEQLRFRIKRSPQRPSGTPAHLRDRYAHWYVFGTRPDDSGDPCWGHFATWQEAIAFAGRCIVREEANRLDQQLEAAIAVEPA